MSLGHLSPMDKGDVNSPSPVGMGHLARALEREAELLSDLTAILQEQRQAVETEDLTGVDATIFSAQRILRTLAEVRVKRRTLLEIMRLDPDLSLDDLEEAMGPRATPEVGAAAQKLRGVALKLNRDLEVNRKVLQSAIQSGEDLARALR